MKVEFSGSDSTSFCIDDLRIAAVKGENTGNDREIPISANILSDKNPSFENVDEQGLQWWNDLSWGKTNIARGSYGESDKPTTECGDYYLAVSPGETQSLPVHAYLVLVSEMFRSPASTDQTQV